MQIRRYTINGGRRVPVRMYRYLVLPEQVGRLQVLFHLAINVL